MPRQVGGDDVRVKTCPTRGCPPAGAALSATCNMAGGPGTATPLSDKELISVMNGGECPSGH